MQVVRRQLPPLDLVQKVLLTSLNLDNIALMPCNPAVGGPAKSNLVKEIDALGGVMADVTDHTYMQFKNVKFFKRSCSACFKGTI